MEKKVIILGSSRSGGNTGSIVANISKKHQIDVIDLNNYKISYYDYESKNLDDDFLPLIKLILEKYDTLIFATPVYWYNMSGIMKVFFDRFSDLIRIEKETGRKLKGKNMFVISNSHSDEIDDSFYIPFKKSADYLGMEFQGNLHFNANNIHEINTIELTHI
ncbi:MAG: flavodoxin family protein [Lutibacter sp.]|uniref:flavodoxin family protein n=1 Tax=Lutibacter sp. TaxID=1925666 RepID=UPI00180EA48F|nr:flavodoxin family protein [Lutibacter sp.]MBT8317752.1 flavodoxin family protein [Lutibacter sp.]NNJ58610.1 flavodoxin family protein [Lutibacter sp.]